MFPALAKELLARAGNSNQAAASSKKATVQSSAKKSSSQRPKGTTKEAMNAQADSKAASASKRSSVSATSTQKNSAGQKRKLREDGEEDVVKGEPSETGPSPQKKAKKGKQGIQMGQASGKSKVAEKPVSQKSAQQQSRLKSEQAATPLTKDSKKGPKGSAKSGIAQGIEINTPQDKGAKRKRSQIASGDVEVKRETTLAKPSPQKKVTRQKAESSAGPAKTGDAPKARYETTWN